MFFLMLMKGDEHHCRTSGNNPAASHILGINEFRAHKSLIARKYSLLTLRL